MKAKLRSEAQQPISVRLQNVAAELAFILSIILLLGTATSAGAQNQPLESEKTSPAESEKTLQKESEKTSQPESETKTTQISNCMPAIAASAQAQKQLATGVTYFKTSLPSGARAHVVTIDRKNGTSCLRPYGNKKVAYISSSAVKCNGLGAINGGFFNMTDGATISYVTVDGAVVCDPTRDNKALMSNSGIKKFLPQILNREEFRVLAHETGGTTFSIDPHDALPPPGWKILHSLQAGPMLLPTYTAREGAFVRTNADGTQTDSIQTTSRRARTAIGIASDAIILLCVEGPRKKKGGGASLQDLVKYFKSIGCNQALNCDGGSSTTMVIKEWKEHAPKIPSAQEIEEKFGTPSEVESEQTDESSVDEQEPCGDTGPAFTIRGREAQFRGNEGGLGVVYSASPERPVKSTLVIAPAQ